MRRAERAITDAAAIAEVLSRYNVCRLALHDDPFPYILPLNYGFRQADGAFTLYFHCAKEGRKLALLAKNPHAAFEVDGGHEIRGQERACTYTTTYESVIGQGVVTQVTDLAEKEAGLQLLMAQCAPGKVFSFTEKELDAVAVLRLDVQAITGKANRS